jgi:hypothetical protein
MKLIFPLFFLANLSFSQGLELGTMTSNPSIYLNNEMVLKTGTNSIDSTFIFTTDTIQLPFFDDFSTNKFQQYQGDFLANGVTSNLFYRLLDAQTLIPLSTSIILTNQQTFNRVYDATTSTFTDSIFTPISVKNGDLTVYPVEYEIINLYPPYYIYDTVGIQDTPDTLWITNPDYFQDSARQFFMPVSDLSKIWADNYAYHNYRFAVNPRSLGIVTFDGIDEKGFPYEISTSITNYADRLTSKPIDLNTNTISDSIYFSFLYQAQGFGDAPEASDSLVLEFYAKDLDQWFRIWSTNGSPVFDSTFKAVHIPLTENKFFKKGFQFRFRNYGSLAGALDHFHIDYVHLRTASSYNDTLFKDFAFVYPLNTLLKNYTSVPWDHYKNSSGNKMTDSLKIDLYNGSTTAENYLDGLVTFSNNSILGGSYPLPGYDLALDINYGPRTFHESYHDLTSGNSFDKTLPGNQQQFIVKASASAQFPNDPINDSTGFIQKFYNFYSYDDGSAEAAFGPTGTQSRLAVRFDAYEIDSLIGINLHFVPSVVDVSNKLFLLTVWSNINGEPGEVLYEDDVFNPRTPIYPSGNNQFVTYYFLDTIKVAVNTSFFVGWRQLDAERLNLGLDRNLDFSSKIKFSVNGGTTWLTSPFPGSAMIRPIFSTNLDNFIDINEINNNIDIVVFPNPTSGLIQFNLPEENKSEKIVYDQLGRVIIKTFDKQIDLTDFNNGIYFLRVPELSQKVLKVLKQ